MPRGELKKKIGPKIDAFLDEVLDDIAKSKITPDEVPALVDAGVAVGLVVLKAIQDRKVTFGEMVDIVRACQTLATKWQDAKRD